MPFLLLLLIIILYIGFPFYWAIRSAFTPDTQLFKTPVQYWPSHPTWTNFHDVLHSGDFRRALLNSTIVAGSVTLIAVAVGSLAGYALGRFRFRGRSVTLYMMLSMTIFPQIAILGALYTLINRVHLYNTLWALIFSDMVLVLPLTVWILTTFMRALPKDLEEAAYIDGATPLQVFYKVMLPLIAPGLVTAGLLAFIAAWQEFLYALSFTETPDKHTVTVAITTFTGKTGSAFQIPWGEIMAATVVVTLPLIVITLALQRRILAGLTAGAVKG
ncbi:MAG: carbohydrate ABC transporter permease [Gaiellaceae bacterium]